MVMSLPTSQPPVSSAWFHVKPKSSRLILIVPLKPVRRSPNGLLVFACWRFYDNLRFRERIVTWSDDFQVEHHDYLLDWRSGERALRYCHFVDDAEHTDLISATDLTELTTFRADGKSGDLNQYSILRKG